MLKWPRDLFVLFVEFVVNKKDRFKRHDFFLPRMLEWPRDLFAHSWQFFPKHGIAQSMYIPMLQKLILARKQILLEGSFKIQLTHSLVLLHRTFNYTDEELSITNGKLFTQAKFLTTVVESNSITGNHPKTIIQKG